MNEARTQSEHLKEQNNWDNVSCFISLTETQGGFQLSLRAKGGKKDSTFFDLKQDKAEQIKKLLDKLFHGNSSLSYKKISNTIRDELKEMRESS